jgi:hypothetical protein
MVQRQDYDLKARREDKREKLPAYWRSLLVKRTKKGAKYSYWQLPEAASPSRKVTRAYTT